MWIGGGGPAAGGRGIPGSPLPRETRGEDWTGRRPGGWSLFCWQLGLWGAGEGLSSGGPATGSDLGPADAGSGPTGLSLGGVVATLPARLSPSGATPDHTGLPLPTILSPMGPGGLCRHWVLLPAELVGDRAAAGPTRLGVPVALTLSERTASLAGEE